MSLKCAWCNATEGQEKVGEDWTGNVIRCNKCSHEYVEICETEEGTAFLKWIEESFKDMF